MFQIFTDWGKFQLNIQIEEFLREDPGSLIAKAVCCFSVVCSWIVWARTMKVNFSLKCKAVEHFVWIAMCKFGVQCVMCNVQVWCVSGTAAWRHSLLVGATTRETSFVQNASDHHNAWLQCGNVWPQRKTSLKSWPCKLFVHFVKTYHYRIWIRFVRVI